MGLNSRVGSRLQVWGSREKEAGGGRGGSEGGEMGEGGERRRGVGVRGRERERGVRVRGE